jgi:hypothetical protein
MTQFTTDKNEIERWSEQHDVVPVQEGTRVKLVPESELSSNQERIDWETFHRDVDENNRVVMYHEQSHEHNPLEVSDQTAAFERVDLEEGYDREQIQERLLEGETVTGTVKETTVVKETIVEEATLESDIVDRNYVDRRVTSFELLERDCQSCTIDSDAENHNYEDVGDIDRFMVQDDEAPVGERQQYDGYPYGVSAEIDERWLVTIEELEEYTVETRITDVDVTETDQIDSQNFESHVDIDAVHDQLLRSIDVRPDDSDREIIDTDTHTIESEFTENDTIRTTLTSRRIIEKELSERWRLSTEVTAGSLLSRETHTESVVEIGLAKRNDGTPASAVGDEEVTDHRAVLTEEDEGKKVVSSNDKIGMITEVDGNVAYVDPDPGLAEQIKSKLVSTTRDTGDSEPDSDQVAEITDDEVRLTSASHDQ